MAGLLLFEGIWMMLAFRSRMQPNALMGKPSRITEDNTAEGDLDFKSCSRDLTGKNISKWPRDHFCGILAKDVAGFCP